MFNECQAANLAVPNESDAGRGRIMPLEGFVDGVMTRNDLCFGRASYGKWPLSMLLGRRTQGDDDGQAWLE